MILKEGDGLLHRHFEHIVDVLPLPGDLQRLPVVPLSAADIAGDIQVRQEMHLDLSHAVALAGFAAAPLDVEGEPVLLVSSRLRFRTHGKHLADHVKQPGIRGGIAAGGPADGALVNHDDLVQLLHAVHRFKLSGPRLGPVQLFGQIFIQDFIDEAALPAAADAGDAGQHAEGNLHVNMLQVVLLRAVNRQIAGRLPPLFRNGNRLCTAQVLTGQAVRTGFDHLRRAFRHDVAAMYPGAGTDVHNPVGRIHRFLIVFHDDDRVSQIPHPAQGRDQLRVVPLMQTDARLIQHIHHAHQRTADLRCQADPLGFAAAEGCRAAAERQISEPHVPQEAQSAVNLLHDLRRNHLIAALQIQFAEECPGFQNAHVADLGQALSADRHRPGLRLQALPAAFRADFLRHVFLICLLHDIGGGFVIPPLNGRDHALKGRRVLASAPRTFIGNGDFFIAGAVENGIHALLADPVHGRIHGKAILVSHGGKILPGHSAVVRIESGHGQRTFPQRHVFIRKDRLPADLHPGSESAARRARAIRAVEGKHPGSQLLDGDTAVRAGIVHAVQRFAQIKPVHNDQPGAFDRGRLNIVRQALTELLRLLPDQPVHHDFHRVLLLFVQRRGVLQVIHLPVNPHPDISAFAGAGKNIPVFALPAPDQGTEHLHPRSFRTLADGIHDFVHRLLPDFPAAFRAVRNAHPRPQQTKIVMNLRHRSHGRARIPPCRLLIDGDRGAEALNRVHVRLVHLPQKLAGIARKAFHIPALAFRINGIKSKGALAAPAQPRDHRHLIARYPQGDVFQIVFPGTPDLQIFIH